ncbi:glycosyltransferase family 2 protein [Dethiosulfovibrio salsuginis]|uniref:Glycosyltransferase, GT2 family n=1 Tax=Dethiosulfovibrio salsuginis TaxID=561720 RepID=A0A1X7K4I6_9BACT|nr:glycosyltransferase [Dethiosulfovibrio salsuginis]SMG35920.1 Glycosyltransferase, GT2 family [Dethiosulfovibrio salsuginis]
MISVVIVTKNRAEALREISLPSLLAQKARGDSFEIIVWDATEDESTLSLIEEQKLLFESKGISFSYFKATRPGMTKQRNDSIKAAIGKILFFIDDDSEVSLDGIDAIKECFKKNPRCMGVGLTVKDIPIGSEYRESQPSLKDSFYGLVGYRKKRTVSLSGSAKGISAPPGPAQWLSGCSMAFRREVFDSMSFNEKLETFTPYAMCEDIEFSYRVFKKFKAPLLIADRGMVIHRPKLTDRISGSWQKAATLYYNRYLLMKTTSEESPVLGRLLFLWTFLRLTKRNLREYGLKDTWRGLTMATKEVLKDG